ncbi:hypothetical protein CTI12_AA051370 [Artemisia annua]|uniref:Helitron helicase-like domain-containing protein n=1 Tax=Artemisia annua TaxID=35608 RepID=A0A2U1P9T3_ARTAN|nr:hypothetical protein CTI12_AA051370 [Artemisia annua]
MAGDLGCEGRVSAPNVCRDVSDGLSFHSAFPGSNDMASSMLSGSVSHGNYSHMHLKRKFCESMNVCQGPNLKRLKIVGSSCGESGGMGTEPFMQQSFASFLPEGYGRGPLILDFTTGSIRHGMEPDGSEMPAVLPLSRGALAASTCDQVLCTSAYDRGKRPMELYTGERPARRRRLRRECCSVNSVDERTPRMSQSLMPNDDAHVGYSRDFEVLMQGSLAATTTKPVPHTSVLSSSDEVPFTAENVHPTPAANGAEGIPDIGGLPTSGRTSRGRRNRYQNIPSSTESPPHVHSSVHARQGSTRLSNLAIVSVPIAMPVSGMKRDLVLLHVGQVYHQIGKLCPEEGSDPRFLQLYIYDTDREVDNRLSHFRNGTETRLRRDIVEGLIRVLDEHNALVQLFRTARDKLHEADVPEFKAQQVQHFDKGWSPIPRYMKAFPQLTAADRPDVVDRIFSERSMI